MLLRTLSFVAIVGLVACSDVPAPSEPIADAVPRYTAVSPGTQFAVWTTVLAQIGDRFVVTEFETFATHLCVDFAGNGVAVLTGNGNSGGQAGFRFGMEVPPGTKFRLIQQHINCSGGFHFTAEVI